MTAEVAGQHPDHGLEPIAARYRRFATVEADGISPRYAELARAVAGHRPALAFLADLPPARQQPNLLFAAVRWVAGTPAGAAELLAVLDRDPDRGRIRRVMLDRTNQMNEPARCGVLLPLLARVAEEGGRPLSLIEVGASAGLCLQPDRYHYRWQRASGDAHVLAPTVGAGGRGVTADDAGDAVPRIELTVTGPAPLPDRMPPIAWQAGLDLNPLDPSDDDDRRWLLDLVWPEHTARAERLRAALDLAASGPRPTIVAADLRTGLPDLVDRAPPDTTAVVVHSAVLAYLPSRADVADFAATIADLGVRWISNEAPAVFAEANRPWLDAIDRDFSLMLDGVPVAAAGPHGQSLRWFDGPAG